MNPDIPANQILILGIGNYLMGDEGVGVHVAQNLASRKLPPGVDVLDGGTGGFHLMGVMEQYPLIIMVDASIDGQAAGTIRLIEPKFASDFPRAMSTHDVGLHDVIQALCVLDRLPQIYLVIVSVETLQPMEIRLSKPVAKAIEEVSDAIETLMWDIWREDKQPTPGQKLEFAF